MNYWSVATLGRALERSGFLVLEITRGMNGEYLEATVRVDAGRDLAALAASIGQLRDALGALLAQCAADGRRVAAGLGRRRA